MKPEHNMFSLNMSLWIFHISYYEIWKIQRAIILHVEFWWFVALSWRWCIALSNALINLINYVECRQVKRRLWISNFHITLIIFTLYTERLNERITPWTTKELLIPPFTMKLIERVILVDTMAIKPRIYFTDDHKHCHYIILLCIAIHCHDNVCDHRRNNIIFLGGKRNNSFLFFPPGKAPEPPECRVPSANTLLTLFRVVFCVGVHALSMDILWSILWKTFGKDHSAWYLYKSLMVFGKPIVSCLNQEGVHKRMCYIMGNYSFYTPRRSPCSHSLCCKTAL